MLLRTFGYAIVALSLSSLPTGCATPPGASPSKDPVSANPARIPPPLVVEWPFSEDPRLPEGYEATRRVQRVTFDSGSATLDAEARGALAISAENLRHNTLWHVLVVGFADRVDERDRAGELGQSRAESVKRFLESKGIDGSRVDVMGLGSKHAEGRDLQPETRNQDRAAEVWAFVPPEGLRASGPPHAPSGPGSR